MKKLLLFIICIMVLFGGCNSREEPQAALEKAVEAIRIQDLETMERYFGINSSLAQSLSTLPESLDQSEIRIDSGTMQKAVTEHLKVSVISSTIAEDQKSATVIAKVENIDVSSIVIEAVRETFDEIVEHSEHSEGEVSTDLTDAYLRKLKAKLASTELPKKGTQVTIQMIPIEDTWQILESPELLDALFAETPNSAGFLIDNLAEIRNEYERLIEDSFPRLLDR